ncbi:hypothetical protein F511_31088 [Dorcoceras hygrometricum]|uniref:Uncharacterized protein n=1 Tax=Dorcoceras hygrometricum TaxID=472368 RepID=A0A2Z7A8Q5_9LAMI|nr:hypothetical protein F511_31088 [Dorcoceras hygrometricum]
MSGLLVQADEGTLLPVVDLIRRNLPPSTVKCRFPRETGRSQAPRRQQGAWLQPESQGDWLFTVGGGRFVQSSPRPEARFLRQPALEGLTRSARMETPRNGDRNKSDKRAAAAAGGGVGLWRRGGGRERALGFRPQNLGRHSPPLPRRRRPPYAAGRRRRRPIHVVGLVSISVTRRIRSCQNLLDLLVKIDGGIAFPIVDLIRRSTAAYNSRARIPCEFGWSQAPRRQQGLTRSARMETPRNGDRNKSDKRAAAAAGGGVGLWRRGGGRERALGFRFLFGNLESSTCVTLNGSGIQLAVGPQPLWLRNHNFGLAQRIMVKRLATSRHDPLGITDSACKNQLVVVSVQYGPFNPYIPIRSTTIGKSRVAKDPIAMNISWRSNSDIASVT